MRHVPFGHSCHRPTTRLLGRPWSRCAPALCALVLSGCGRSSTPSQQRPPTIEHADGKGESTKPWVGAASGIPVETAPPNVPEFKPAFPGQTRAFAIHTKTPLVVTELVEDLDEPWALAFLPDGRMLVTEKHRGRLVIVTNDGKKSAPTAGVPRVDGRDQGGLLDIALGPDYAESKLVYLSYYEPRGGGNGLAVARARLAAEATPKLEGLKVIFRMEPTLDSTMHAGGRLVFAPDGTLFVTLGERSILKGRVQARDLGSDLGKSVRILPDGAIPKDNPFVDTAGARPEIWTRGHRNVLGAALDARHRLWVAEMGPRGGDELNLIERGKDYGWPTIGYGEEYSGERIHATTQEPGLEQPIYYWDPVISPGALAIYSGDLFPEWKGNFFIAGLSSKALIRLALENDRVVGEERLLMERGDRIRDVVQGPDGAIYLLTDGSGAKLLKLTPGAIH
jgi:glucose/arabinose dehydrogenase